MLVQYLWFPWAKAMALSLVPSMSVLFLGTPVLCAAGLYLVRQLYAPTRPLAPRFREYLVASSFVSIFQTGKLWVVSFKFADVNEPWQVLVAGLVCFALTFAIFLM
jgi:hypothetical protein